MRDATRITLLKILIVLFISRLTYGHIFVGIAVFRAAGIRDTRQMRSERKKERGP